ncbi:diguanylate cyclase [Vibrio navarrensis]
MSVIAWLFLMMAAALLSGVHYFLTSLDTMAETALTQRVGLALSVERRHQQAILSEYTYWDEAYEKIMVEKDTDWIADNTGEHLIDNSGFDFSVAIQEQQYARYLLTGPKVPALTVQMLMEQGLNVMMAQSQSLDTLTRAVGGYLRLDGSVYLVVGGPLINEQDDQPRAGTFLALGKKMDHDYLAQLATNYQLPALKINDPQASVNWGLKSPLGTEIGSLSWETPRPSERVFPQVSMIVLVFSVLSIWVTWLILAKARRSRARYEKQLYLDATTDALTQLKNRRYFMEMGHNEQRRHHAQGKDLCLLLIDLDHFKSINDTHGHSVGDALLTHFVRLCEPRLRKTDTFGRLGGDEFAVLLPETTLDAALDIANRLRAVVNEHPLSLPSSSISLTISIGLAKLQRSSSFEQLVEHADKALYQAKRSGRGTIRLYHALASNTPSTPTGDVPDVHVPRG